MARTYVITGAGSGIGATTAAMLRAAGHNVVGVDLHDADVSADLGTSAGRVQGAADAIAAAGGSVDAVIACAGLSADTPVTARVNFFGVTEFLAAMRPTLAKSAAPRVAVISSMSSLQPNYPPLVEALLAGDEDAAIVKAEEAVAASPSLVYASSKRALSRWVRREAPKAEWAGAGIPLNAVGPGIVKTPMTAPLLADAQQAAFVDLMVPMPLNGHETPEVIANLLIWLTSVENSHICGQTIYIDGGSDVVLRGDDVWSFRDQHVAEYFQKAMGG